MVDLSFTRNHITSLTLPFLSLEVFADDGLPESVLQTTTELLAKAWPFFLMIAEQERLYDDLALNLHKKVMEVEVVFTNNATMRSLNQEYRQKEGATDVLTFTLLADAEDPQLWMSLPVLQLGSIFVSIEYAQEALREAAASGGELSGTPLEHYLLERFIHGMLHLLGLHHDTMEKYDKVVHIQKRVLEETIEQMY